PVSLAMFYKAGKVSRFGNAVPGRVDLNLAPRNPDHGELVGERIDPQIISPLQFNVTDGLGEPAGTFLRGGSTREGHLAVDGHKECGTRIEILDPSQGAILSDGMGD